MTQIGFGSFFQDNWRVSSSLTLNLGLRYEFVTVPEDVNGATSALRNFSDSEVTVGTLFTNATKKSFSPRVGFAWAPGDRKTSVRGGFGIFYIHPQLYQIRTALSELPPFVLTGRVDADRNGNIRGVSPTEKLRFPDAFFTQLSRLEGRPAIRAPEFDQKNAYVMRWSLNLQRELGTEWMVSAGYTGSRGVHLWQQSRGDLNQWVGFPNPVPTGEKFFPADAGPIQPNFGDIRIQSPNGNSYYHGLSVGAQQRPTQGLQWQVAYTLSKAIDQGAGVTSGGDNLPQSQRGIYLFDLDFKRSLSSLDIRNNFVANFSYDVPTGDLPGIAGAIARGWQLNGILTLTDGHPLTPLDPNAEQDDRIGTNELLTPNLIPGGDGNRVLGGPDRYFDTSQFTRSTLGFFGNVGRNTLTSPGLATFDFSVFKNIDVTEKSRVQFRAEFFNLFNRANFGDPNTNIFKTDGERDPDAGRITRTTTSARQIQFGLKFLF